LTAQVCEPKLIYTVYEVPQAVDTELSGINNRGDYSESFDDGAGG